jgi:hypothetical protein
MSNASADGRPTVAVIGGGYGGFNAPRRSMSSPT